MILKKIFDIAIGLMDETDETGTTENYNTEDYAVRTPLIMNALYPELYEYDCEYRGVFDGNNAMRRDRRLPAIAFSSLDDDVLLDDYLCASVVPYGLAAHLLADENPVLAQFLYQRYDEQKRACIVPGGKVVHPAEWDPVPDLYGGLGFSYQAKI